MTRYQPGCEVHWIQARHAITDRKNWTAVRVIEVVGNRIVVEGPDDTETLVLWSKNARQIGQRKSVRARPTLPIDAALSIRWRLLAISGSNSMTGANSHGVDPGTPLPVHTIVGASDVRLISVSADPL